MNCAYLEKEREDSLGRWTEKNLTTQNHEQLNNAVTLRRFILKGRLVVWVRV